MTSPHCSLIEALSRNAHKFNPPSNDSSRISDLRQRFETQLLILFTRGLTSEDVQSLSRKETQELNGRVNKLCDFLDRVSSIGWTSATRHIRSQFTIPQSSLRTGCSNLEHVTSLLDEFRGSVDISGSTHSAVFQLTNLETTRHAYDLVVLVNEFLQQIQRSGAAHPRPAILNRSSHATIAFNTWIQSFADASSERFGKLLDTVALEFDACKAHTSDAAHGVRTQLLNYETEDLKPQETLDFCLYCPNLGDWQVTRCEFETELHNRGLRRTSLCQRLQESQSRKESLALRFHENSKFFGPNSTSFRNDGHGPSSSTLRELIKTTHSFALPILEDEFSYDERRALAAKLALHLSVFGYWRHSSLPWDGESIYFLHSARGSVDRASPYINWRVKQCSPSLGSCAGEEATAEEDSSDLKEQTDEGGCTRNIAKSFASFAKLLIEIEFGEIPNTRYPLNDDSMGSSLQKYVNTLHKAYAITHGGYLQAIDACLRFHKAYEEARFYQSLSLRVGTPERAEDTYRRLVRSEIASPILIDLLGPELASSKRTEIDHLVAEGCIWPDEAEFVFVDDDDVPPYDDTMAEPNQFSAAHFLTSLGQSLPWTRQWLTSSGASSTNDSTTAQSVPAHSSNSVLAELNAHPRTPHMVFSDGVAATSTATPTSTPEPSDNMKHTGGSSLEDSQRRGTDKWFSGFVSLLQDEKLRIWQAPGKPLRIAILDSGINFDDKEFNEEERERIKERKTFIGGSPDDDAVGHGTNMAAIILRLTVDVEIYIGKVTDSNSARRTPLVNAINHARTEWKVDMISLSLGFEQFDSRDGMQAAIKSCTDNSILVFAAASNDGPEGARTYPAQWPNVMCVHASSYLGESYKFNPPPQDGWNLSTVGEHLRPVWGRTDLKKSTAMKYESGTSYATPVAVAIAAFMIQFIRVKGWADWQWMYAPWTPEGMRRIMEKMSVKKYEYDWVSPTRYIRHSRIDEIEMHLKIMLVRGKRG